MTKVAAFVPIKLNSRRLPNKNFLRLGDRPLAYHIFETLSRINEINSGLYCFTSQPQVLALLPDTVQLIPRPRRFDGDHIKANELFQYAVENISADVIILCHATGPFIRSESIAKAINAVVNDGYDCAFSVTRHQTYCWYQGQPLNYSPVDMAQTQDLDAVYAETSGFYVFKRDDYLRSGTRISGKPYMVEIDFKEAVDIDEPQDFELATQLLDYDPSQSSYSEDRFFIDLANNTVMYKNIKHISFDLDGILIDSLNVMNIAWDEAMRGIGSDVNFDLYKRNIGIPFVQILKKLGFDEGVHESIKSIYDNSASSNLDKITIFDGVGESIKRARAAGLLVSLVTSKCKNRTDQILSSILPRELFDVVVTPEDVPTGRGKPNPDPLLMACLQLGVDPNNSIYVGDMSADRDAAYRAGFHFIHGTWGFSDISEAKDVWFDRIEDMIDFILE